MSENNSSCSFRTSIGGQALIEGILMRGPKKEAIVCRTKDGLVEKVEELKSAKDKYPILGWPLIRGCAIFLSSMIHGMQALTYSADLVPIEDEGEKDKLDLWIEKHFPEEQAKKLIIGVAVVLGIALSLFLFIFLPAAIVGLIKPLTGNYIVRNLSEGFVRVCILLVYMRLCSCMSDMKRVFSYHGAEHKTIFCYEAGLPLTVENVRTQPRHHPRCGTSFLFVVIFVSILASGVVFGIWPVTNVWLRTAVHLLLLPLVVGVTYEFNRWVGRHSQEGGLAAVLTAPGLWMQNFTTFEPDDSMIEVAIRSLELVLPSQQGKDAW